MLPWGDLPCRVESHRGSSHISNTEILQPLSAKAACTAEHRTRPQSIRASYSYQQLQDGSFVPQTCSIHACIHSPCLQQLATRRCLHNLQVGPKQGIVDGPPAHFTA
jgi:hypothetical protein